MGGIEVTTYHAEEVHKQAVTSRSESFAGSNAPERGGSSR